jgi:hypothetical protein
MLAIKNNADNFVEITATGTLKSSDLSELGEKVDAVIKEHGNIRIVIDASGFDGWDSLDAAEQHFTFVKRHHESVERLAIVAGHMWQHWLAIMIQVFVHPQVKAFDKDQIEEARKWAKV